MKVEVRGGVVWAMAETHEEVKAFLAADTNGHKLNGGWKNRTCKKCGETFAGKQGLSIHTIRAHSNRNWTTRGKVAITEPNQ